MTPAGLDPDRFLAEYWQKKPLLLRGAFRFETPPISPEELAGLACEVEDEARLIQERHPDGPWRVDYGPFSDEDFAALPDSHWTLLVTDCEKHRPALRRLIEPFRFIPDWRIDDLMISYAADQGSVGPHVDAYDVFLIQLDGVREWRIGGPAMDAPCLPDLDLRILANFTATDSWRLSPGDLLYLPPGIAHHGIARSPCLTASVGFRAPSHREILQAWLDSVTLSIPETLRLGDPGLPPQASPSEISADAARTIRQILERHLQQDDQAFHHWLGAFLTETNACDYLDDVQPSPLNRDAFLNRLRQPGTTLTRHPRARIAWQQTGRTVIFSRNGESTELPAELLDDIRLIGDNHHLQPKRFRHPDHPELQQLLYVLYSDQILIIDDRPQNA